MFLEEIVTKFLSVWNKNKICSLILNMQRFLPIPFLFIALLGLQNFPKMVAEIALQIILQPLRVFPNKNLENSENPETTPSTKVIIEGIYKTYFEHNCITQTT